MSVCLNPSPYREEALGWVACPLPSGWVTEILRCAQNDVATRTERGVRHAERSEASQRHQAKDVSAQRSDIPSGPSIPSPAKPEPAPGGPDTPSNPHSAHEANRGRTNHSSLNLFFSTIRPAAPQHETRQTRAKRAAPENTYVVLDCRQAATSSRSCSPAPPSARWSASFVSTGDKHNGHRQPPSAKSHGCTVRRL